MKIRFWCRGQTGVRSSQVDEKLWKVNGMEWKDTIECGYKNWDNLSSLKVIKNSQGYVWKAIGKVDLEDGYRMKIMRGKVVNNMGYIRQFNKGIKRGGEGYLSDIRD